MSLLLLLACLGIEGVRKSSSRGVAFCWALSKERARRSEGGAREGQVRRTRPGTVPTSYFKLGAATRQQYGE